MARPGIFFILILFFLLPGKMLFAQQSGDTLHANSPDTLAAPSDTFHLKEQLKKSDTLVITSADTGTSEKNVLALDTTTTKKFDPKVAMLRSAIIPGWGQIYNKKYWKVPIVWGALGVTGYIFFNNLYTYKDLKFAYAAKYKASLPPYDSTNPRPPPYQDSTDYFKIKDQYKPIDAEALRTGRNLYRQYIDYAAVFFIVFWGLNVVDAAVDAHLKAFDISPDLSLKIRPNYNPIAKTGGVSFVFNFKH